MQNWTGCSALARYDQGGKVIELTDIRDNNKYKVAKLKDGKCWMTQNLAIQNYNLTSTADSDVSSPFNLTASSSPNFGDYDIQRLYIDPTYGGYYNWYTATAGSGTKSISSGNAKYSIYPKGWKLPSRAEYQSLINTISGLALYNPPANFLNGDAYTSSDKSSSAFGSDSGYFWARSSYNSNDA